jgi:hypothetical protein
MPEGRALRSLAEQIGGWPTSPSDKDTEGCWGAGREESGGAPLLALREGACRTADTARLRFGRRSDFILGASHSFTLARPASPRPYCLTLNAIRYRMDR